MTAIHANTQNLIDERLDALDRALLGLLPRSERLAVAADVEARIRATHEANPTAAANLADQPLAEIAPRGTRRRSRPRRSGLALTAGVLGILALVFMLALPVTYVLLAALGELIGEFAVYALIIANIVLVAFGGTAAVVLGITALVRLNRRHSHLVGRGWAVTGLCTGPVPMLCGGLAMLLVVFPMLFAVSSEYTAVKLPTNNAPQYCDAETMAANMCQPPALSPAPYVTSASPYPSAVPEKAAPWPSENATAPPSTLLPASPESVAPLPPSPLPPDNATPAALPPLVPVSPETDVSRN